MNNINRRSFLGKAVVGLGGATAISQIPSFLKAQAPYLDIPIGFQTFPIRDRLGKDFAGTLKTMQGFGYSLVEMCSPAGYASIGFGFVKDMKGSEIKKVINDAGLSCP